jgi:hypothetical protein
LQAGSSIQVEPPKRAGMGSSASQWLGRMKDLVKTNF